MKFKKIAAIISTAAVALALTGCGNDSDIFDALPNNPQNWHSSGTASKPAESKTSNSKPTESTPIESEPEESQPEENEFDNIPVADESDFSYHDAPNVNGFIIGGYLGTDTIVRIPKFLSGKKATYIGDRAFKYCTSLTSVTIPDSVTEIGDDAFADCKSIQVTYKGETYDYDHINNLYSAINGN